MYFGGDNSSKINGQSIGPLIHWAIKHDTRQERINMNQDIFASLKQPVKKRLPDQVALQIKKLILSRQIKEGEKIPPDRTLSETLGVSRVVIQEAVRSLERSGFLEVKPGARGGWYVANNLHKPFLESIADIFNAGNLELKDFFETRTAIECLCARNAAQKITDEEIRDLEKINLEFLEAIKDPSIMAETNLKFHVKIAEISGNSLNKLMIVAIMEMMSILYAGAYQSTEFIRENHERHAKIIEALKSRDPETAEKVMSEDISLTLDLTVLPKPGSFVL